MPRYYDIDKLKQMIGAKADTIIEGKEAFLYVAKWIDYLLPADVVPRAEVERLEKQIKELLISETCELYIPMEIACRVRTAHPIFKAIKSEVAKEFAERLKAKAQFSEDFGDAAVSYDDIDDLVKQMTEEHYETQ